MKLYTPSFGEYLSDIFDTITWNGLASFGLIIVLIVIIFGTSVALLELLASDRIVFWWNLLFVPAVLAIGVVGGLFCIWLLGVLNP